MLPWELILERYTADGRKLVYYVLLYIICIFQKELFVWIFYFLWPEARKRHWRSKNPLVLIQQHY